MPAQWNLSSEAWDSYVINITLTDGSSVQCVLGSNTSNPDSGTYNLAFNVSTIIALVDAVTTAAGSLGTASSAEFTGGPNTLVLDPCLLTFPVSNWELYFGSWAPDGGTEQMEVLFLVPSTGILTGGQITSLISALTTAINEQPDVSGITLSQMTMAPVVNTDGLAWTAASAYDTGWEASGEGVNGFYFSLAANGLVYWMCDLKTTVTHPGTTICSIPSRYVPSSAAAAFGMCESSGSVSYPLAMQTSGTVQVNVGSPGSSTRYVGSGFYPLAGV